MKMEFYVSSETEPECHFENEIYQFWLIIRGSGILYVNQEEIPFLAHDVLELPPHIPYHIKLSGSRLEFGCILLTDFKTTNTKIKYIPRQHTELIRKTFFYALDLQGMVSSRCSSILNSVSQIMLEALLSMNMSKPSVNPWVFEVMEDINEHFRDSEYDVNQIIAKTGYSKEHFRKLFSKEAGQPPLAFINQRRIEHAASLMNQEKNLTIREIALQSGFNDAYYFSRIFKKSKGISPTEYMELQIQKDNET